MNLIKIIAIMLLTTSLFSSNIKIIAFAQDDMSNDFRKAQVIQGADEAKKHKNIKYIHSDAKGQVTRLITDIDKFISAKVDCIIVGTNDESALNRVIEKAHNKGIKVIILDRGVTTDKYTTFINSNNLEIGQIGGEFVAKELNGKGLVLLLEGIPNIDVTKDRTKGFMSEMNKHKGIKVIKRTANYQRRDAIVEMEKVLKAGIKVDAIFAGSDSMISGARSALMKHKIDPSTIITVGCDYVSEAAEAIKKGTQTGSVLFPLGTTESVQIAIKLFAGEKAPKHISIPVKLVNKNNVNQVKPIF